MNIKLHRNDFFRFERLVSKLDRPSNMPADITISPWDGKIMLTAFCEAATLTLEGPDAPVFEPFTLPWKTVKKVAAKRDDGVEIDRSGDSVTVTWNENGVPQQLAGPFEEPRSLNFALLPERHGTLSVDVFAAIAEAGRHVDTDNRRYSLGGVSLQGSRRRIAATDGRQMLILNGIELPWEEDPICPAPGIFGSKELREIGKTVATAFEDHGIYFQTGNVCIRFREIDGRFPNVDPIATEPATMTWLHLDPADAEFLAARIDNLPRINEQSVAVVLEFGDGRIVVSGHNDAQETTTELLLTRSSVDGSAAKAWMDRAFLKSALQLGVERIGMDPAESPLFSYAGSNLYLWMPLTDDNKKRDHFKVTAVESGSASVASTRTKPAVAAALPSVPKSTAPVAETVPVQETKEPAAAPTKKTSLPGVDTAKRTPMSKTELETEADRLRSMLRDALVGVNSLTREIRASRKRERELQKREQNLIKQQDQLRTTIASLGKI